MPPSENTPLIQAVPVEEHRERYPHRSVRRYCTIALAVVPVLSLIIIFIVISISGENDVFGDDDAAFAAFESYLSSERHSQDEWRPPSHGISHEELKQILIGTPDPEKAREWSQYYTAGPHLCGKNLSQAEWTRDKWAEFGIPHTEIVTYELYLNYPVDHRLALLEDGEVRYEASLEEDALPEDPSTNLKDSVPTFHGYSASGDVTAPYVYCNYGTFDDFEELLEAGVFLEGKIALVRYGKIFRGLKVKRAAEMGMVGVIMYSDPGDDGDMTEENGYKAYPDGPARNPSSVQRGSVQYISVQPGDPTTPGYPSKPGVPRQSTKGKIPDIPSLPISYQDALPFLKALNGYGPNASSFSTSWHGGGLGYKGVDYNIGPTPDSLTINLMNEQEYVTTPAWNTIGIINGSFADEVVIVGNHRDAWIAGGAADPNSGSAALNEVIRSFGIALQQGWKPLRTIVFASWDGEEYGLLGSTEWVEEFYPWLRNYTVAYINVDVGANGPVFRTAASPLLNKAILEVTAEIQSPNQTVPGQSVRDTWDGHIATMGSGSDFTAFQDYVGIPSIDLGFTAGPEAPVYHYHSNYDSFTWMDEFGDPGFEYHVTIAKIIGLLTAKLANEVVIDFRALDYPYAFQRYVADAKKFFNETQLEISKSRDRWYELETVVSALIRPCDYQDAEARRLRNRLGSPTLLQDPTELEDLYAAVKEVNGKYMFIDKWLVHEPGLDSRPWFKHIVFAPGLWTGYSGVTFPGLVEAIEAKNETGVEEWLNIITEKIGILGVWLCGMECYWEGS